ncbi:MAG: PHP domain-containing protein [Planctomycetota bacterium]|nr:PHP domain-containing protein [Planctomycetota bacterium]
MSSRRFVDLHTHSTASDGSCPPGELMRLADAERLAAVALTDHDTTGGLADARAAAGEFADLRFVAGVEVSALSPSGTMHIIGLGIDENSPAMRKLLADLLAARNERNPKIIAKLQAMGVAIEMADVLAARPASDLQPDKVVSRMHIAEALRRKGCAGSNDEVFERYIGKGAPAYVEKDRLPPPRIIDAIHQAGGLAVLAHPVQLLCTSVGRLERLIADLAACGMDGIEVYHSDHSPEQTRLYLELARRFDLGVTGGSDFHGAAKPKVRLGRPRVPLAAIGEKFEKLLLP